VQSAIGASQQSIVTKDGVTIKVDAHSNNSGMYDYTYDKSKYSPEEAKKIAEAALQEAQNQYQQGVTNYAQSKDSMNGQLNELREKIQQKVRDRKNWGEDFFADLPKEKIYDKTFSDDAGTFSLRLPRSGKFAIIADSTFDYEGESKRHWWGLWVDLNGEG